MRVRRAGGAGCVQVLDACVALGDELGDGSLLAQRRGGAGYSPGPLRFLGQRCVTIVSVRSRVRPAGADV